MDYIEILFSFFILLLILLAFYVPIFRNYFKFKNVKNMTQNELEIFKLKLEENNDNFVRFIILIFSLCFIICVFYLTFKN